MENYLVCLIQSVEDFTATVAMVGNALDGWLRALPRPQHIKHPARTSIGKPHKGYATISLIKHQRKHY